VAPLRKSVAHALTCRRRERHQMTAHLEGLMGRTRCWVAFGGSSTTHPMFLPSTADLQRSNR
jgi:hypothetical protein